MVSTDRQEPNDAKKTRIAPYKTSALRRFLLEVRHNYLRKVRYRFSLYGAGSASPLRESVPDEKPHAEAGPRSLGGIATHGIQQIGHPQDEQNAEIG